MGLFRAFVTYMKTQLGFQGVSGWVNFTGNDKLAPTALKQVRGDVLLTVGMAFPNGSLVFDINGGPVNESWKPARPDPEPYFPYMLLQVLTPILCCCMPSTLGIVLYCLKDRG